MTGNESSTVEEIVPEYNEVADSEKEAILSVRDMKLPGFDHKIDFAVHRGEIIGVAGLQGNGQSELIQSLFALNGSVNMELYGDNVSISRPRAAVAYGLAYLSGDREHDGIYPDRSIRENMRDVVDLVRKKHIGDTDEILNRYGVKYNGDTRQKITSLSGGNQQKVVVARWLASEPNILLLDDPTKGIDVQARYDLHAEFRKLADAGSAVIMVSSDDDELVSLTRMSANACVIVMHEGRIVKVLRREDITRANIIKYSFDVSTEDENHEHN
jgi:ABC-type sugar transport system ATPase subunit